KDLPADPEAAKARLRKSIENLQERLRNRDFTKKKQKPSPPDSEIVNLNKQNENIQEEYDKAQYENELKNRNFWQKAEDVAIEVTNGLFRGLVAGLDLSAVLVQGAIRLATSPRQVGIPFIEGLRQ